MKALLMSSNQVENIGPIGRALRIAVGVALLVPVFFSSGAVGGLSILAILSIIPVLCGVNGYCPITAWYENLADSKNTPMSTLQRVSYAVLATSLIGSVFGVQGTSLGVMAVLPLLGIYPAVVAILGENIFSELLRNTKGSNKRVEIVKLNAQRNLDTYNHDHVKHAA